MSNFLPVHTPTNQLSRLKGEVTLVSVWLWIGDTHITCVDILTHNPKNLVPLFTRPESGSKYSSNKNSLSVWSNHLSFVLSERPSHRGGGHDQTGVPPVLQQEWQAFIVLLVPILRPHALHGLPPLPLPSEFLPAGQGRGRCSVGLQFWPVGLKEPASPGEPDLHQSAEQRVQRLAPVEVWPVLQNLHPEDPAADARLSTEPGQVRRDQMLSVSESGCCHRPTLCVCVRQKE